MENYSETTELIREREARVRRHRQTGARLGHYLGVPALLLFLLLLQTRFYRVRTHLGVLPKSVETEVLILRTFLNQLKNNPYALAVQVNYRLAGQNRDGLLRYNRRSHLIALGSHGGCRADEEHVRGVLGIAISNDASAMRIKRADSPYGHFFLIFGYGCP